jgi:hypothetical protein
LRSVSWLGVVSMATTPFRQIGGLLTGSSVTTEALRREVGITLPLLTTTASPPLLLYINVSCPTPKGGSNRFPSSVHLVFAFSP